MALVIEWARRNMDRVLCGVAGAFCFSQAYLQPADQERLAIASLAFGTLLIITTAVLHRVTKIGLPGGGSIELEPEAKAAATLAAGGAEEVAALPPGVVAEARLRLRLASETLDDLFHPGQESALAGCAFDLYLYDAEGDVLQAVFTSESRERPPVWKPGTGATGTAWQEAEFVLAVGDEASGPHYGLTPSEQERYRHLAAVASMPVFAGNSDVIAVLTAYSNDPETGLKTERGFDELVSMAETVRAVLVDVLEWFPA